MPLRVVELELVHGPASPLSPVVAMIAGDRQERPDDLLDVAEPGFDLPLLLLIALASVDIVDPDRQVFLGGREVQ